eukprot:IDg17426t1
MPFSFHFSIYYPESFADNPVWCQTNEMVHHETGELLVILTGCRPMKELGGQAVGTEPEQEGKAVMFK